MKAIVMAGGFAKRLWPLTHEHAKPLIKIGGKPVINYTIIELQKLKQSGMINEIIVSTNAKFEQDFKKWSDANGFDVNIIVEPSSTEEEKLGAIGAMNFIINKANISDDVLILNGDNLFDFRHFKFSDVINFFKEKNKNVLCAFDVITKEKAKMYGNVSVDNDNKIIDFQEKPEHPKSSLISMGCYVFKKESLSLFDEYLKAGNKKDAQGFFVQWLYKKDDVFAYPFKGAWFDIGDHESLIRADEFARKELS
jgi:glucose-1-phosphate thymidylyltransferase